MYYTKEINSKQEAIELGKNRGWCTSNPDSIDYDLHYNKNYGRLFVIYKKGKQKPQYQIFFANDGGIELREKFNEYVSIREFFDEEGVSLKEWYNETRRGKGELRFFEETNFISTPTTITAPNFQTIGRAIRTNGTSERRFRFVLKFQTDVIELINNYEELPPPNLAVVGSIFKLITEQIVLLNIKDEHGEKRYIVIDIIDDIHGIGFTTAIVTEPIKILNDLVLMCTNEKYIDVREHETYEPKLIDYNSEITPERLSVKTITVPISGTLAYYRG